VSDRLAEAVAAVGAIAMIGALLLPWWSGTDAPSGFELAVRVDWVIAGAALLVLAAAGAGTAGAAPWLFPVAAAMAGGFVAGLLLVDPIELGTFELGGAFGSDQGPNRGVGYYVEVASALLVAVSGCVAAWRNASAGINVTR
jgi:hypothetical protein